jgi:hypothetical protein
MLAEPIVTVISQLQVLKNERAVEYIGRPF